MKKQNSLVGWMMAATAVVVGGVTAMMLRRDTEPGELGPDEPTRPGVPPFALSKEERYRAEVVRIAGSQLGSTDASPYWTEVYGSYPGKTFAWCGVFALWVLHQAGLTKAKWLTGPKEYGFIYPLKLPMVASPKPGDIAYFNKNQHQAIVASVSGNGWVTLINGNGEGGAVTESQVAVVTAFYSITKLIEAAP